MTLVITGLHAGHITVVRVPHIEPDRCLARAVAALQDPVDLGESRQPAQVLASCEGPDATP